MADRNEQVFSETGSGFEGLGGIALPRLPLNAPPGDPGEGLLPPLILDQTEARRAQKNFSETGPLLSKGLDDRLPPSPYLKAWIRH